MKMHIACLLWLFGFVSQKNPIIIALFSYSNYKVQFHENGEKSEIAVPCHWRDRCLADSLHNPCEYDR